MSGFMSTGVARREACWVLNSHAGCMLEPSRVDCQTYGGEGGGGREEGAVWVHWELDLHEVEVLQPVWVLVVDNK